MIHFRDNSSKQCKLTKFCKSLLVGSAPKPLKNRACALWLCRIPASFDLLAAPEIQKKEKPLCQLCCCKQHLTQGLCYRSGLSSCRGIFLFWQVVAFQNIEIILGVIQCCELRFQFFECGMDFQSHYIF